MSCTGAWWLLVVMDAAHPSTFIHICVTTNTSRACGSQRKNKEGEKSVSSNREKIKDDKSVTKEAHVKLEA